MVLTTKLSCLFSEIWPFSFSKVFSKTFNVNDSGNFNFSFDVAANFDEGTYVLIAYQGLETSLSVIGVEENPESILIVKPTQLNYSFGSTVDLKIQGEPHKSVSLVIIDDSFQKKISDSIKLDDNGNYIYEVDSDELGTGAFEVEVRHGNSRGETIFTVGLSTGSVSNPCLPKGSLLKFPLSEP